MRVNTPLGNREIPDIINTFQMIPCNDKKINRNSKYLENGHEFTWIERNGKMVTKIIKIA